MVRPYTTPASASARSLEPCGGWSHPAGARVALQGEQLPEKDVVCRYLDPARPVSEADRCYSFTAPVIDET